MFLTSGTLAWSAAYWAMVAGDQNDAFSAAVVEFLTRVAGRGV